MELKETTVSTQTVYEGIIVNVRRDKAELVDGRITNREVVEHPGGVCVFALDSEGKVILVRQYRYPMGEVVLELPAGKLEKGEDPSDSGLRELGEETGLVPETYLPMGVSFSSPGILEERIYYFFATDLVQGPVHPDDGEFLEIVRVPYQELVEMAQRGEIKDGKSMSFIAKCGIWLSAALLYACEVSPVVFRLEAGKGTDGWVIAGIIIMAAGLCLETAADLQKNAAKKKDPKRFVDTGLFRIVRCPNYFGEMTFWTGVFITGIGSNTGAWQWIAALAGYLGIIYVMFGGARRLEIRQNRTYGDDPEYQAYVKKTPIMIPFIPLYSVEKYKWLVA